MALARTAPCRPMGWLIDSVPPPSGTLAVWFDRGMQVDRLEVRMPTAHAPSQRARGRPMILIGIDPHKSTHTAVAIDSSGNKIAHRRFPVNAGTFGQLMAWSQRWPERRFAVEGARGLGRGIAQQLAADGEHVVDVPSTLSARARMLATGGGRKTDAADALHVAHVALFRPDLRQVRSEDQATILRLLTERRDDLVNERTRLLNRLHVLLRDLVPGGALIDLSAEKAAQLLRRVRPVTATDCCRRDLAETSLPTCAASIAPSKTTNIRCEMPSTPAEPRLPTCPGWASSSLRKSSAMSATSTGFLPSITSPATPAAHRWKPPAATTPGID